MKTWDGMRRAVAAGSLALLFAAGCGGGPPGVGPVQGEGPIAGTAGTASGAGPRGGSGKMGEPAVDRTGNDNTPAAPSTPATHAVEVDAPGSGSAGTASPGAATGNSGGTSPSPR